MGEDGAPVLVRVDQALYLVGHENKLQPITIVDLDQQQNDGAVKEDVDEDRQDTVAVDEMKAGDKSMEMEKTGFSAAEAANAGTVAANVNWLIDIDKDQAQPKIKFEDSARDN